VLGRERAEIGRVRPTVADTHGLLQVGSVGVLLFRVSSTGVHSSRRRSEGGNGFPDNRLRSPLELYAAFIQTQTKVRQSPQSFAHGWSLVWVLLPTAGGVGDIGSGQLAGIAKRQRGRPASSAWRRICPNLTTLTPAQRITSCCRFAASWATPAPRPTDNRKAARCGLRAAAPTPVDVCRPTGDAQRQPSSVHAQTPRGSTIRVGSDASWPDCGLLDGASASGIAWGPA